MSIPFYDIELGERFFVWKLRKIPSMYDALTLQKGGKKTTIQIFHRCIFNDIAIIARLAVLIVKAVYLVMR